MPHLREMEDVLTRMQRELVEALKKPRSERRWQMVIDLSKCVGCSACTIGCVAENKLPPGVVYRPVLDEEIGTYPNVTRRFVPRPCMQCEKPPCVKVCPVNATWRQADGIVKVDYEKCIGCRYCIVACPYAARTFDFGGFYTDGTAQAAGMVVGRDGAAGYERASNFEYAVGWSRAGGGSPVGNARKCQFCYHRLEAGMLPVCTSTCIGRATYFGDASNKDTLVSQLLRSPRAVQLKAEAGTHPSVYYIM